MVWSLLLEADSERTYLHLSCSLCTKTQSMMDLLFFVRLRRTFYGQFAGTGVHASSRLSWTSIDVGPVVSWSSRSHTSQSGRTVL